MKPTKEQLSIKPFAQRLSTLMKNENGISPLKRKVTQEELANEFEKNGISIKRQTISLYTKGVASPNMEKFKIIADYFDVSYDFLLGESDAIKRGNVNIAEQLGLTDGAISFLEACTGSNIENRTTELISMMGETYGKYNLMIINKLLSKKSHLLLMPIIIYIKSVIRKEKNLRILKVIEDENKKSEVEDVLNLTRKLGIKPEKMSYFKFLYGSEIARDLKYKEVIDESKYQDWRIAEGYKELIVGVVSEILRNPETKGIVEEYEKEKKEQDEYFEGRKNELQNN